MRSGVSVSEKQDKLIILVKEIENKGGSTIDASNDHRIAMSFAILGSITEKVFRYVEHLQLKQVFQILLILWIH